MKATLELPDELLQRIKLRAVHRKRKLKDEIAHLLEAGMAQAHAPSDPTVTLATISRAALALGKQVRLKLAA